MKGKWAKDYCPYCRDQNMYSVVGDVDPGETIFGFPYSLSGASATITFRTETRRRVSAMANTDYRVEITKVSSGSEVTVPYPSAKGKLSFTLNGENGKDYDIIVKGKISY